MGFHWELVCGEERGVGEIKALEWSGEAGDMSVTLAWSKPWSQETAWVVKGIRVEKSDTAAS